MVRGRRVICAFVSSVALASVALPALPSAADPGGPNCWAPKSTVDTFGGVFSVSCRFNSGGTTLYTGMYGAFRRNNMYLDTYHYNRGHSIAQRISALGNNFRTWHDIRQVSVGVRNGKTPQAPHTLAYYIYWEEKDVDYPIEHFSAAVVPDGGLFGYQVVRVGACCEWNVYYHHGGGTDLLGRTSIVDTAGLKEVSAGLELWEGLDFYETVGAWAHSDTFDLGSLQSRTATQGYTLWNDHREYRHQPCGQFFAVPNCFNGLAPTHSHWSNNKP